ncbi:hypothetical protein [Streptomyces nymphaeiformis]|uniref:Uncharacterized protein n=1 Tax=Streptomyces nymphaeiformis TaxID=2663842 RepID=A0A7W7U4D8_9ACTN|nr:hypothetical protein [Streptomyces nymphaeiformis]MBB4984786.1 hypothetical protein [Streptomyces nymphaeiformis]
MPDMRNEKVDERLGKVTTTLTGTFVAIAGVATAVGISQDSLLAAVNNDPWLYFGIAILGAVAVALGIWSLFQGNDRRGNRKQAWLLGSGTIVYMLALFLAIAAVARVATGNGRPNVTNLSVVPGSPKKVSFTVHADGVQGGKMLIVEAEAFDAVKTLNGGVLYRSVLHADDHGDIEQSVEFVIERSDATRLTVRAFPDHEDKDGATCESDTTHDKLGCATVLFSKT